MPDAEDRRELAGRRDGGKRIGDQARLAAVVRSAVEPAVFTLTESGRIASWSAEAEQIFRYPPRAIVGCRLDALFTDRDREAAAPARILNAARRDGHAAFGGSLRRSDGTTVRARAAVLRLSESGLGFAAVVRDLDAASNVDAPGEARQGRGRRNGAGDGPALQELLRRLVRAQEDERARIARDLHDSIGQQLTALRLALERHEQRCRAGRTDASMADALALLRGIGREIDALAWGLRPAALDDLGLSAALPRLVDAWSAHVGIPAAFHAAGSAPEPVGRDAEVVFYRIVQEALNNIAKHARATRADVVLSCSGGRLALVVEDNGVGFDPQDPAVRRRGIGLASMRERASLAGATLEVESAPGKGTTVVLRAPIDRLRPSSG